MSGSDWESPLWVALFEWRTLAFARYIYRADQEKLTAEEDGTYGRMVLRHWEISEEDRQERESKNG